MGHILINVDLLINYLLCLSKAQYQLDGDMSEILSKLQNNFRICFNPNKGQHKSIAFGHSSSMHLHDC